METRILIIALTFIFGCKPDNGKYAEADRYFTIHDMSYLRDDLKVKDLVIEFVLENKLNPKECVIVIEFNRSNIERYSFHMWAHNHNNLPFYPDRYTLIRDYLVFFYTEFNPWLDREVVERDFRRAVMENGVTLTNELGNTENPTWIVDLEKDSIIGLEKKWQH